MPETVTILWFTIDLVNGCAVVPSWSLLIFKCRKRVLNMSDVCHCSISSLSSCSVSSVHVRFLISNLLTNQVAKVQEKASSLQDYKGQARGNKDRPHSCTCVDGNLDLRRWNGIRAKGFTVQQEFSRKLSRQKRDPRVNLVAREIPSVFCPGKLLV